MKKFELKTLDKIDHLTKREIHTYAQDVAQNLIDEGMFNPLQYFIQTKKLSEFLTEFIKLIEEEATNEYDKYNEISVSAFGVEINQKSGGKLLDYESDHEYTLIKKQLSDRKILLDTAFRLSDQFFDNDGIEIPKVKIKTIRKDSLTVKY